jgi:serine-type D-Ala-D-Ala carboxypeptidase/endopeptidase (penicillin-binding protein 4)
MTPWLERWMLAACALAFASGADLDARLDPLVRSQPAGGVAGIQVVEAASGRVLYALNPDRLLSPASNLKILTSAMVFERLGPDYRFTTRVLRDAAGNMVLYGSGDPSMSGRAYPMQKNGRAGPPLAAIENLAEQLAARGITRIDGDIIGDDGLFPWDPYPPSWTQDDTIRDFGAPVSALTVNDNVVAVSIVPGARAGDPAGLAVAPALEYLTFDNRVVTLPRGSPPNVHAQRLPGSRQWLLSGGVPAGAAGVLEIVPVDDPALFAAYAFYDALTRKGIAVRGRAVARHRAPGSDYATPAGEELATRVSPPLGELLQVMDKVSQNLHAELLLREAGRVASHEGSRGREGTTEGGVSELRAYLTESGAAAGDWRLDDGSGLSRNALVTPRVLAHILTRMAESRNAALWIGLLPVGGEDGTLSNRLCCLSQGRGIRAKTGSLNRALALSGYADSKTYGQLAFSVLVNDFSAPAAEVRLWIDKIATALLD